MNRRIIIIIIGISVLILTALILFQIHRTDRFQMASSILPGDLVLVSRLTDGIQTGEVRLFHDPTWYDLKLKQKPLKISRIAALPGDQLSIRDKALHVNQQYVAPPPHLRRIYRVITDGSRISDSLMQTYHLESPVPVAPEAGIYDLYLDTLAYQAIRVSPGISSVRETRMFPGDPSSGFWPYSDFYAWNRDQVGPLTVPYSGWEVDISLDNIAEYRDIIENHEGREVLVDFRGVQIDGHFVSSYTFTRNYFFVLDDNRDHPDDSRIIGYIPEDHLKGKVLLVIWSPLSKSLLKRVR